MYIEIHRTCSYQILLVCIHMGQCSIVPHQPVSMTELGTEHPEQWQTYVASGTSRRRHG